MIKYLLMLFVVTILLSGCATLNEKPDPFVGQWKFQFSNLRQGDPNAILAISKEAGVYSGTITNSNGEYGLTDLLIEAGNSLTANFQYQGYSVAFNAQFDGNTISGQSNVNNRTFSFAGERMEQ